MVYVPAVTFMGSSDLVGTIRVSGPGQNFSTTSRKLRGGRLTDSAIATEFTRSKIGLDSDRPFTVNNLSTAASLYGSTPRPYAVSVGKAMMPPRRRNATIS